MPYNKIKSKLVIGKFNLRILKVYCGIIGYYAVWEAQELWMHKIQACPSKAVTKVI